MDSRLGNDFGCFQRPSAVSFRPPTVGWQAGDAGSQADNSVSPRPPPWHGGRSRVRASLPRLWAALSARPDARWNVFSPWVRGRDPGEPAGQLSQARAGCGCLCSGALSKSESAAHVRTRRHAHTHPPSSPNAQARQGDGGLDPSSCTPATQFDFGFGFCSQSHSLINLRNVLYRGSRSHFPNLW